jgi:hypothetical protein
MTLWKPRKHWAAALLKTSIKTSKNKKKQSSCIKMFHLWFLPILKTKKLSPKKHG